MKNPENLKPAHVDQTVILIAEDEVLVANIARIVLESDGYFILIASDGQDALFISRQYPGTIHLLLSDIKMPHLNGLELSAHSDEADQSIRSDADQCGAERRRALLV